uniref:NACHT, LRR and PYD domains-containing protein 3-like n=2 Tax=Callorhinchus milii TaxID=7868 RepID=A0A4W3GEQ0_CALMI|eukprot:gi/632989153/ref/XP_007883495.1/ PREDICTED: NACHT, LRR and PYD domains-containing protein 3-like [Callorhinchus milii]
MKVNTILVKEKEKTFKLVDRYTELTIISDLRGLKLVEHELVARGRDHENCREKLLQGELEKIRIDQLFHSSFSTGTFWSWIKSFFWTSEAGTSAVVSGVAGIGKTTMVQKIVYEWARGEIYPDFHFVFIFKCRDLNSLKCEINLKHLILDEYPHLRNVVGELWKHPDRLLFIFDGLDEFSGRIDFADNQRFTEPRHMCTNPEFWCEVSDILHGLIQKKLLKGCSVLVTSRPTALHLLEKAQVSVWAELLGFVGEEKKEYFQNCFESKNVGAAVYKYVEENKLLFTLCYNPSYCWILGLSLGPFFTQKKMKRKPIPKTVTQLFSYFIYNILKHHCIDVENTHNVMLKLGEMAFNGICHKKIVFNNEDLIKYGLKPSQFLSGFLMELVEKESSEHSVVYTFLHLTIQEFLAALAQFLSHNPNLNRYLNVDEIEDGRFEIFHRFLAGLSSPQAAHPLEEFVQKLNHQTTCSVIDWVKVKVEAKIRDTDTVAGKRKLLNTFHYLFESQNHGLARQTLGSMKSLTFGASSARKALRLTPIDCVVLSHTIGLCDTIKKLDLRNCYIQDEGLRRLVPELHKCQELWLLGNNLGDSGMKALSEALRNRECKIEKLRLQDNGLTDDCTKDLASALSTNHSLTELYLDNNKLGDLGVKRLSGALRKLECKIQKLDLGDNSLTNDSIEELASVLRTNSSLKGLNLDYNKLGDSGVKLLSTALSNSKCKIERLWLSNNSLTAKCTQDLASALSKSSSLTELYLNCNNLGDSGVEQLSEALRNRACKIEKLWLESNGLTGNGIKSLASALSTNRSLTELHLDCNKLKDSGIKQLSDALRKPECKLERLWLRDNRLTDDCTEDLVSALSTNHSLTELYLDNNNLGDSGMKRLSGALRKQECKLQKLELGHNNLTAKCTEDLASALSKNCSLTELHLHNNKLADSGVKRLFVALRDSGKIQQLWLQSNSLSDDCTNDLISFLRANSSLKILSLESNFFTDQSVQALCEVIETNRTNLKEIL